MTKLIVALMCTVIATTAGVTPVAAQRGTPAEAQALLKKAVGRKVALADFTAKKAPFVDRDLYVFCIGPNGNISAHGAAASYVGTSANALKDAEGKPLR